MAYCMSGAGNIQDVSVTSSYMPVTFSYIQSWESFQRLQSPVKSIQLTTQGGSNWQIWGNLSFNNDSNLNGLKFIKRYLNLWISNNNHSWSSSEDDKKTSSLSWKLINKWKEASIYFDFLIWSIPLYKQIVDEGEVSLSKNIPNILINYIVNEKEII